MKKRLLVVEDDRVTVALTRRMLIDEGYFVDAAMESNNAIKLLTSNDYDLVILDISMPILNGFDIVELLHSFEIKTKIVFLTNLSDEKTMEKVGKLDIERFISKEKDFENLPRIINEILA